MLFPNAVIAGFPKCGTTSLFSYLAHHPQVCASSVKETYYLMDEGHPLFNERCNYVVQGMEGYAAFFASCKDSERILLEATPDYFYQKTALDVLSLINPRPLVVFILRDPAKRAYSLFKFAQNNLGLLNKNYSFSQYINDIRNNNNGFFKYRPILRNVIEHGKYVEYVDNWADRVGKDKVRIFLFEDLVRDPHAFMQKVSQHLGINEAFYESFVYNISNPSINVKFPKVQFIKNRINKLTVLNIFRGALKSLYYSLNVQRNHTKLTPNDTVTIARLRKLFDPYNKRISEVYNVEISHWE